MVSFVKIPFPAALISLLPLILTGKKHGREPIWKQFTFHQRAEGGL